MNVVGGPEFTVPDPLVFIIAEAVCLSLSVAEQITNWSTQPRFLTAIYHV